ncbi:MAG TPA: hypothetical protein PK280_18150 [Planctomycetota bacterium]|nr:hypothetical protein [Planctomycetota bacterium]
MAVRSRARGAQDSNPFILLGVAAALVGMGMVGLAAWYFVSSAAKREQNLRISRGVEILNKMTGPTADFFYSGKGLAEKRETLPPEAWAAIKEYENDPDFVDAMVTKSVGAENHFVDAFRYKTGKTAQGEPIPGRLTSDTAPIYHGEPGPPPEPNRARIQILMGTSVIGGKERKVMMFRRSILVNSAKTDLEYGKAMVLMFADVPVPASARTPAADAAKADPKADDKGDAKPEAKPEAKTETKPSDKPADGK